MSMLKDTYPLYLNNKAVQSNTDLAVTDKYTGEVAFRVALADSKTIDVAIAGAVKAAEHPPCRIFLCPVAGVALLAIEQYR